MFILTQTCIKAWPCSTRNASWKNHFINGLFLSHFSSDWGTQTTCETRAALPSGSFSSVHDNICVTITLSWTFWSSETCWWPTFTLASNFEHQRHWSFRKDKIFCTTDLFKDSVRKAEEEHIKYCCALCKFAQLFMQNVLLRHFSWPHFLLYFLIAENKTVQVLAFITCNTCCLFWNRCPQHH